MQAGTFSCTLSFFPPAFLCLNLAFQDLTFLEVSKLGFQVYEFPVYRKFHVNMLCWISWNNLFHFHLRCAPIFKERTGLDLLPFRWFPGGSDGEESVCNAWDLGSISGLGRSPGEENGNPLQYSCLENPNGLRSLAGYSPWICKESHMIEWLSIAYRWFPEGIQMRSIQKDQLIKVWDFLCSSASGVFVSFCFKGN